MIISSIGFRLKDDIFGLPQTSGPKGRIVVNERGRVRKGIYVTGWCKTGPRGALADTMASSYETADTLIEDYIGKIK